MDGHRNDVQQTAMSQLCSSGYTELKHVSCNYNEHGRVLTLGGRVSFFYLKQYAQEVVRRVEGVDRVINLIEVKEV